MSTEKEYQVLARKYRPQNFDDLIGQAPLVQTLKNAIETGRIAHAFMLTGIRGVGKTTTARIIAKALNYTGADGKAGPTTGNTDDCETCQAISEGRHPDVIEMDAASHTGVDDVRELIDGVRYAPSSARYKIYIIDEVHMLSKNAFNALLKTLEEPPSHVKFIFATTEIRKVPVTVLSRCQRFDLRRIELSDLEKHFKKICSKEGSEYDEAAITMISQAADGSVRDGLSLLDQAIALGDGKVEAETVKNMLGLTDGTRLVDLFEAAMTGKTKQALSILETLYAEGADPAQVIEDLLELTHSFTKIRILKGNAEGTNIPHGQQERAESLAYQLSMPGLNRAWQILMKGLHEVQSAPNAIKAAEMVLIRLIYANEMPDPLDLIKKIQSGEISDVNIAGQQNVNKDEGEGRTLMNVAGSGAVMAQKPAPQESTAPNGTNDDIDRFDSMESLYDYLTPREILLANELYEYAHPVKFSKGFIEIRLKDGARGDITKRLSKALKDHTGNVFMVSPSTDEGLPSLADQKREAQAADLEMVKAHENVTKIVELFPGTKVTKVIYPEDEA